MPAGVQEKIVQFVEQAYAGLEQIDYYRLLGVSSAAKEEQIRTAYYKLAAHLHPDIHGDALPTAFGEKLTAVFSRVVEAYKVLTDQERRANYDDALATGDMRLRSGIKRKARPKSASINNASARRFFDLAEQALANLDRKSAIMNLKLALSVEPNSELLKNKLAETEKLGGG